ncbi:Uncharacterized protein PPKH_3759 [Pseudomonas putida]|nr:Uncharacterized protein PPKH_3759 [Pseudomonas putida]
MTESFRGRGDDVTQRGGPGKAARLTDQSALARHAVCCRGAAWAGGKSAGEIGSNAVAGWGFQWVGLNA